MSSRGQMGYFLCYGYPIWSKEALIQVDNVDGIIAGGQYVIRLPLNGVKEEVFLKYLIRRSANAS